ncbi:MAG: hypothetical protein ACKOCX_00900 [Planctomycetota bacterium]
MNRRLRPLSLAAVVPTAALLSLAATFAQPPEGPPRDGPPPHGPADRLRAALDANGDHELDEGELAAASEALKSLDEDGNGRLDRHEFRPPLPPPPRGGFGDRGPEGRPPREGGPEVRRPREGFRPEGEGPRRERPDGPPRPGAGPRGRGPGPSPERFVERAMAFDADGDGKLDRDELGKFAAAMRERMTGSPGGRDRGAGPPPSESPESE